jgi:nucleotide-binding universal stress UspA family protein
MPTTTSDPQTGKNGNASRQLYRAYDVVDAEHPLHGVTFEDERPIVASGPYLVRLASDSGRVVDRFATSAGSGGLAYDGRYLWQRSGNRLQQLELRTGSITRSIAPALDEVTGLACVEGELLVLHGGGRRLSRFRMTDRATATEATLVGSAEADAPMRGLAWADGHLWSSTEGTLVRIDPATARVTARVVLPSTVRVRDLAADVHGRFWIVDGDSRTVRVFELPDRTEGPEAPLPRPSAPPSSRVLDVSSARPAALVFDSPATVAGPTFDRILVPVDFSAASRRALATALVLQDCMRSEVHLFHHAEQGSNAEFLAGSGATVAYDGMGKDAEDRLRRFVDNVFPGRSAGVVVHAHGGTGLVEDVEAMAREVGATLVLLSGGSRHGFFRSRIERIARDLDAAVIVLAAEEAGAH